MDRGISKKIVIIPACTLVFVGILYNTTNVKAQSLEYSDYYNYQDFAKRNGYKYVSSNNPEWDDAKSQERYIQIVYETNAKPQKKKIADITAKHSKGFETTLSVQADYLTEEETVRQLGAEIETRISIVIGSIGGAFKWGNSSSVASSYLSSFTVPASQPDCTITYSATAELKEYYLLIVKERRIVNTDKKGNVTGYGNRTFEEYCSGSGKFQFYDLQTVEYMSEKK